MFKALLKARLQALLSSFYKGKTGGISPVKKALIGLLLVYVAGVFLFIFGSLFFSLALPLANAGLGWLYFALAAIMAAALMFVGSVFMTMTQLYDAKDNELLLSMPIPPSYILGSRMLLLLIVNLMYELLIILPAGVIWCIFGKPSFAGAVCFLFVFAALPFLSFALSAAVGWVIAKIALRVRNKSIVSLVLFVVFMAVYFTLVGRVNVYIAELVENSAAIAEGLSAAIPVYWLGASISDGNFLYLIPTLLICLLPFALVMYLLSTSFISMITDRRGIGKIRYRGGEMKVSSPDSALLRKELKHLFSSSPYLLNSGTGSLFTLAGAVVLAVKHQTVSDYLALIPGFESILPALFCLALCYISSMVLVSAPSISIEGKNLWITRSMPVDSFSILRAKLLLHLVIALPPCLIAELVIIIFFGGDPLSVAGLLLLPLLFNLFIGLLGLLTNLHFPKFDWINETVAVKQTASVAICIFGSWGVLIAAAVPYIWLQNVLGAGAYMIILSALFAAVCAFMYYRLRTYGVRRLEEI